MLSETNKILILKWGALGDLIAAIPAINRIVKSFPNSEIDIVSNSLFKELFPPEKSFYKNFFDFTESKIKLLQNIRHRKYDLVINLKWTSEGAAWITLLSGAKLRAGSGPESLRFFYNLKSPYRKGRYHEILRNFEIVKGIGNEDEKIEFIPYIYDCASEKIKSLYDSEKIKQGFTIGVHPGASKKSKRWASGRFAEVIKRLVSVYDINFIVFYGKEEYDDASFIVDSVGSQKVMLNPSTPSLSDLIFSISKCNLFFSNNSGPMNLAVSIGTPVVALLGSTHPDDWGPYGEKHRIIRSPLYLNSYSEEDERTAMSAISTSQVFNLLNKRISELYKINK